MKNNFLILFIAIASFSFSQTTTIKWSEPFPVENQIKSILMLDNEGYYYTFPEPGDQYWDFPSDFHTVNKMSYDFKPLINKKASEKSKNKKDEVKNVNQWIAVKDGILAYTVDEEEKNVNTYSVAKFHKDGMSTPLKVYHTVNQKDLSRYLKIHYAASPDSAKVVVVFERYMDGRSGTLYYEGKDLIQKQKRIEIVMQDNNGGELWKNTLDINEVLENDFHIRGTRLSSNGNILLWGIAGAKFKVKRDDSHPLPDSSVFFYLISNDGKSIKKIDLASIDKQAGLLAARDGSDVLTIKVDKATGNFLIATSYNNDQGLPAGILFIEVDKSGNIIKKAKNPIPASYVEGFTAMSNSSEKKEEDRHIEIVDILTTSNGIFLVAQYKSEFGYKYQNAKYSGTEYLYNYGDIYLISLDNNGNNLSFVSRIPVVEHSNDKYDRLGVYSYYNDGKIYLFRNYYVGDVAEVSKRILKAIYAYKSDDYNMLLDILDLKGGHTQKKIYKTGDVQRSVLPMNFKLISPNRFLIRGLNYTGRGAYAEVDRVGILEIKP